MPLAELQSKWGAKLISRACRLPVRDVMVDSIETQDRKVRRRYNRSAQHTLPVDFHLYRRSLEQEMRSHY